MSRLARVVVPGLPHHVTQRGNRRDVIFVDDADRFAYRQTVSHYFTQHNLRIWAYCMMTNHVHFVAVPGDEDALGRAFRDAHTNYALAFNRRHRLREHLWQGRFYSCPLDEGHLWAAVRYVERNPEDKGTDYSIMRIRGQSTRTRRLEMQCIECSFAGKTDRYFRRTAEPVLAL